MFMRYFLPITDLPISSMGHYNQYDNMARLSKPTYNFLISSIGHYNQYDKVIQFLVAPYNTAQQAEHAT